MLIQLLLSDGPTNTHLKEAVHDASMLWLRILASRLRAMFASREADRELNREIEKHLRSLVERFMRQGMSPEDAEYAARRQFGGITQLREFHREAGRIFAQQGWQTSDLPWILATAAGLLLVLTLVACWFPVRRALAVDPVATLRPE